MTVKAEKGDLIRITADVNERIKIGDIYEVENANDGQTWFYDKNGAYSYVYHMEYVIHRKAGEEGTTIGAEDNGATTDNVNHPSHYTQGGVEVIDIIAQITRGYTDGFVAYALGNTLKYIARAPYKHDSPTEDIKKAIRYLEFALNHIEDKDGDS